MKPLAHTWPVPGLVFALVLAAPAWAQAKDLAFVAVGDLLLEPRIPDPYLAPACLRGRRLIEGEHFWLGQDYDQELGRVALVPQAQAPFAPDVLTALLHDLLARDDFALLPSHAALAVRSGFGTVVQQAIADLRLAMPPVVKVDVRLARITAAGETMLFARTIECRAGCSTWGSSVREQDLVVGYDVEIAQGAATANPQVLRVLDGCMVVLRPVVAPSEASGSCELLVRVVADGAQPPIETGDTECGAFDRAAQRIREFAGVVPIALGRSVQQEWAGASEAAYRLTVTPSWQVTQQAQVAGHAFAYVPCWNSTAGFRSVPWTVFEGGDDVRGAVAADFRQALELTDLPIRAAEAAVGYLAIDEAAARLAAIANDRISGQPAARVRLVVFDAPAGAVVAGDELPAGARCLGRVDLQSLVGSWSCATDYEELSLLADWDVEVAQSARIPVPRCRRLATGLFVDVRCVGDDVEVAGEVSWRDPIATARRQLDRAVESPGMLHLNQSRNAVDATTVPALVHAADIVVMERADLHRLPFAATLRLRRETPTVWRCTSPVLETGRELLVAVRRID